MPSGPHRCKQPGNQTRLASNYNRSSPFSFKALGHVTDPPQAAHGKKKNKNLQRLPTSHRKSEEDCSLRSLAGMRGTLAASGSEAQRNSPNKISWIEPGQQRASNFWMLGSSVHCWVKFTTLMTLFRSMQPSLNCSKRT